MRFAYNSQLLWATFVRHYDYYLFNLHPTNIIHVCITFLSPPLGM